MVLDYASVAQSRRDVGRATHCVHPRPEPPAPSGAFRLVYLPRRRAGEPGPRDNVHVLEAWPLSRPAAAAGATSAEPPWVGQGGARERI